MEQRRIRGSTLFHGFRQQISKNSSPPPGCVSAAVTRYLQTDDLVPRLGAVFRGVVALFPELLPGSGFALSHRVDGLEVRGVGQHGHAKRVSSSEIQLHRGGEVGEHVAGGWRAVGELAEATHLTEHELERSKEWMKCVVWRYHTRVYSLAAICDLFTVARGRMGTLWDLNGSVLINHKIWPDLYLSQKSWQPPCAFINSVISASLSMYRHVVWPISTCTL